MTRWTKGESAVERFLGDGSLQQITGAATDGRPSMEEARLRLSSAESIRGDDPSGAFTLAYDAARLACTGLLAQQGLRPTREGGHKVVEDTMRAQFDPGFADFGWMRRRRNEVEYPVRPHDHVSEQEIQDVLAAASRIIDNADRLIGELGYFNP